MTLALDVAQPLRVGETNVRIGVTSWSDKSLTQDSTWYPKRTMKASERIAFYSSRFSIVEMETTYRFPPTPAVAEQWVDRTPSGFKFNIPGWSLFTGQPTMPVSLWDDLINEIRTDRRDRPRLYANHLSNDAIGECWNRFRHAIAPLAAAGKLGVVTFRYPRWFGPKDENRETITRLRHEMRDFPIAVEFANADWVKAESCETTFSFLEELDISFVCVDASDDDPRGLSGTSATTNPLGVVRLLGRKRWDDDEMWQPDRRGYRYSDEEFEAVADKLGYLASCCEELHVLFATAWRDDAVRNAELLTQALQTIRLP